METETTGTDLIALGNRVGCDPTDVGRGNEKEETRMTLVPNLGNWVNANTIT